MRLLIDTQILIWFFESNPQLSSRIRELLVDVNNEVYVSRVSLFEIAIKLKIGGRLSLKRGLKGLIQDCRKEHISILSIADDHLLAYDQIPLHADHRDPFDRLLLATALAEKMPLISADGQFHRYSDIVEIIW